MWEANGGHSRKGTEREAEEVAVRREAVPMNILIVDDEMSISETCAAVSEQCGMKAVTVATADEALQVPGTFHHRHPAD